MTALTLTGANHGSDSIAWEQLARLPGSVADLSTLTEGASGAAVPAAALIDLARPDESATHCTVISRDGSYRASIPLADLSSGGWLAFRLGDDPLPDDRGGPLRLTVARGRTLCWNVKDVGELRFTDGPEPDDIPARPTH